MSLSGCIRVCSVESGPSNHTVRSDGIVTETSRSDVGGLLGGLPGKVITSRSCV